MTTASYKLEDMFSGLSDEQRQLQFGTAEGDPLTEGFPRKRVVHAGLSGQMVPPEEAQAVWNRIMETPAVKGETQAAYIHIPFCKTRRSSRRRTTTSMRCWRRLRRRLISRG